MNLDPITAQIAKLTIAVNNASSKIAALTAALEAANAIPRPTEAQIQAAADAINAEVDRLNRLAGQ